MSHYEIRACLLSDLRELARTMRPEDRAEIERAGRVPRHLLVELWRMTPRPLVAIVDGEVAAAWGDTGALLGEVGSMWAFTAPVIERVPLAFYREAKREIAERLRVRRVLRAHVADSYRRALRFFGLLGFVAGPPLAVGSDGALYREIRIERPRRGI